MESRKWSRESIFAYGAHCSQSAGLHRFCHQVNTINSVFLTSLVITLLGIGAHFTAKMKTLANKLNRTFPGYNFETSKGKVFFLSNQPYLIYCVFSLRETKSNSTCKPCFVIFKVFSMPSKAIIILIQFILFCINLNVLAGPFSEVILSLELLYFTR